MVKLADDIIWIGFSQHNNAVTVSRKRTRVRDFYFFTQANK